MERTVIGPVEGEQAIARIMGLSVEETRATLEEWYGAAGAEEVLRIGRIWERDVLTRRERSFVAVAVLASVGALSRLPIHVRGALHHGATREEVEEVLLTVTGYAGHGLGTSAPAVAREVLDEAATEEPPHRGSYAESRSTLVIRRVRSYLGTPTSASPPTM